MTAINMGAMMISTTRLPVAPTQKTVAKEEYQEEEVIEGGTRAARRRHVFRSDLRSASAAVVSVGQTSEQGWMSSLRVHVQLFPPLEFAHDRGLGQSSCAEIRHDTSRAQAFAFRKHRNRISQLLIWSRVLDCARVVSEESRQMLSTSIEIGR